MASSYSLNPRQFASVSVLDGNARVQHFVARVADWEQVWSLKAESGWPRSVRTLTILFVVAVAGTPGLLRLPIVGLTLLST